MSPPRRCLLALLLCTPLTARADGTAVWLSGAVDPSVVSASTYLTADELGAAAPWGADDDTARALLASELDAVRPLLDVFDGELQILRRLDAAIEAVTVARAEDRDLIHDARTLQGLAIDRYYQDGLATDPDAGPWRTTLPDGVGGTLVVNRAWVDAIALDPETLPDATLVPDDDARLGYQDVRARLLIAGDATIAAVDLPAGGSLVVDGVPAPAGRARVLPGEHRIAVVDDAGIRLRQTLRLAPDQTVDLPVPARTDELQDLARQLDGSSAIVLPPRVATTLARLDGPVTIVVGDRRSPVVYRVDRATALPLDTGSTARAPGREDSPLGLRAGLGLAWVYDGEWYLEHAAEGAPEAVATVNGALPMLSLAADARLGAVALSAGADLAVGAGQWQRLQVGETSTRLRAHPYLAAGLPWLQATVGAWLPWRLGVGARAHLPLPGPMELTAGGLYGLGLQYTDDNGDTFVPAGAWSAWAGVGVRLPQ